MADNKGRIEALMMILGERGRFQIMIHLLLSFTYVTILFNHVIMAFYGTPIPHTCMPNTSEIEVEMESSFGVDTVSASSVYYSGDNVTQQKGLQVSPDKCTSVIHLTNGDNKTMVCGSGQWKYSPNNEEKNIVSEFDLVCNDKSLASIATTIYFAGVMVGGLLFGDLADRFGRLPIMIICMYSSVVIGIVIAFSVNYTMFVILRFINGILIQGLQTSAYTMIMELFRAKYRPFGGAVAEIFFGSALMILAGYAYFLRDWRHLQIAISVTSGLSFFYVCVVPESLRWLITKGKMDKAEALIAKICRVNKIPYPKEAVANLQAENVSDPVNVIPAQSYNITYLFRTPKLRKRSLILAFIWCVNSTCYYGVTYKMTRFSVNRYLIFFIGGAVEVVVYILSIPIMNYFGRKKPLVLACITGGVMCLISGFVNDHTQGLDKLTAGLALLGRCCFALVFGIIFVYTSELFPTVIRNIGMGFACFWARVGGVFAPQINQWSRNVVGFDAIIIFGILSFFAGVLVLLLQETHNAKLADSIEDVERSKKDMTTTGQEMTMGNFGAGGEDGEPCLKSYADKGVA